ncbi:LOB domain-containing protein 27-like [Gastrolobium bilobum]|uniref:LOB domain-containing protein 27-like n=1 Tax=Gastrolobium bilobum TaxID=150636 RepID=UPI002AB2CB25|nr:LOB domain-containing protein 27-like [Gastrolobium bilobum]
MTHKGGINLACASCKYQRRKCTPECPLAPYFPADQPRVFLNVHKLFGVSNINKMLKKLEPSQKRIAMETLITQANYREMYPVHGCWEEVCRLRYQIWQMEEELHVFHQQLEMYRQHHQHQGQSMHDDHVTSQLELGMAPSTNALPLFNAPQSQIYNNTMATLPVSQQHSYSNNSMAYNSLYMDSKDYLTNQLWVQHPYTNHNNSNSMTVQSQLVTTQPLPVQQEVVEDYDEIHPFFDHTIDDRQSYIYSEEAYEPSSEESLRDTRKCIETVAENELKSAAACFSLTSVS